VAKERPLSARARRGFSIAFGANPVQSAEVCLADLGELVRGWCTRRPLVERVTGIEPAPPAWKLYQTQPSRFVEVHGIGSDLRQWRSERPGEFAAVRVSR
jgi:hypothetical protein